MTEIRSCRSTRILQAWHPLLSYEMDEDPMANRGDALHVAFLADGSALRTVNTNRAQPARTWDIATGRLSETREPDAPVAGEASRALWDTVRLGPADRYLADKGRRELLIRESGGNGIVKELVHESSVNDAAMSPDGRFVATAGADGTVSIFLFNADDLTADACRKITANLTGEQWQEHIGFGEASHRGSTGADQGAVGPPVSIPISRRQQKKIGGCLFNLATQRIRSPFSKVSAIRSSANAPRSPTCAFNVGS